MSKHLVFETTPVSKPLLLLVDTNSGESNNILNLLIDKFYSQVDTYVLSKKQISQNASKISPLGIHLLDRLREKISYAVLFLESEKQKGDVLEALEKLEIHKTKVLIFVPVRQKSQFIDIFLELKSKSNVSVFFVGDIFGNTFRQTKLSKLIVSSLSLRTIEISGNGLTQLFPISDEDFSKSVQHVLFGVSSPTLFYNAYYKDPQTLLSLAHHLKRVEPELSLSFDSGVDVPYESFAGAERILSERVGVNPEYIKPHLGFDASVSNLTYNSLPDVPQAQKKKRRKIQKKKIYNTFQKIVVRGLIGLALYGIVSVVLLLASAAILSQGISKLAQGNVDQALFNMETSQTLYVLSSPTVMAALSLPQSNLTNSFREYIKAYIEIQENIKSGVHILRDFEDDSKFSKKQIEELQTILTNLYFLVQKYELPMFSQITNTEEFRNSSRLVTLLPFLSKLAGFENEQSYVLLFQNNNELRPTGGFIGSVGYLTLKDGEVKSLLVEDVYDLDGQLKGHVEPHYIIRRYLQPSLYLRDSNFNPDFDISASSSAFLYNTESKRKVDGVIAIDTQVLKKLIEIAGPIKIDSEAVALSSDTIVATLQDSIQEDYFEGSTKKKQLLGELVKKLTVIFETDRKKQFEVLQALPDLMYSKHILFSFPSKSLQQAFVSSGLSGSLKDKRAVLDIPDFLSINEANIGVNKINADVSRKVSYSARLEGNTLFSDAALTLENKGSETYRAYIRFVVPENSNIVNMIINGDLQQIVPAVTNPILFERLAFQAPVGLEVDNEIQDGHKMIGFVVEVPSFTTSNIHLLYSTSYVLTDANIDYSLLYIKQPGTLPYPFLAQIESSDDYKQAVGKSNILINKEISGDLELEAELFKTR